MNRADCGQNAMLYFYGELEQRLVPEFERHLKSCAQCRTTLELIKAISGPVAFVRVSPPAPAVENIRGAVLKIKVKSWHSVLFPGRLLRPAAAFAAAVALVLGLEFFAGQQRAHKSVLAWNDDISSRAEQIASDIDGIEAGMDSQDVIGATDYDLAVVEGLMGGNSNARR